MTRVNPLVLDGSEVKLRLQAERAVTGSAVHVDWLRFTVNLRHAPLPAVDDLFPLPPPAAMPVGLDLDAWYAANVKDGRYCPRFANDLYRWEKLQDLRKVLNSLPDADFAASAQAKELAVRVADALGPDFSLHPELLKGHDFYRFRWSIVRNGDKEVAWVGFLASSTSPQQKSQANTIHVNITGTACTFADVRWPERMAALIEDTNAKITRCDLALDFFDGIRGGMPRVLADHEAGLMDVRGKRPAPEMVGNWTSSGHSRSFYFGSKEAGKQTNVYEKGHQLYGPVSGNPWQRIELRYGNKLRVLSVDMLRRPSDFFAGASDWHAALLAEHGTVASPEPVKCKARRALETVCAEASRNVRWLLNTAAPSVALAFQHLGDDFLALVTGKSAPGRLQAFNDAEIADAYPLAFARLVPS